MSARKAAISPLNMNEHKRSPISSVKFKRTLTPKAYKAKIGQRGEISHAGRAAKVPF